jgi:glycosyltransferase involved in cell wall biosynthesis
LRILYFFPRAAGHELPQVQRGEIPSDRFYGLWELRRYGHDVDVADGRFHGVWSRILRPLRRLGINACDPRTLALLRRYDVILVKDEFSELLTLACRTLGVKLVYLDAMFEPPRRRWKAAAARAHLGYADGTIAYSKTQIALWAARYRIPEAKFQFLPYTLDMSFYKPLGEVPPRRPYVLAVGRDAGRQFSTLVDAMEGLGIELKIVTVPYLLNRVSVDRSWIEVRQHVSYAELFQLYAGAALTAIPLKRSVTYPSGVRGMLEAMAVGRAVVSSHTPVLKEYAADGDGVLYAEPENPSDLRRQIMRVMQDAGLRQQLQERGLTIAGQFGMDVFARGLESYLTQLVAKPKQPEPGC